MVEHMLFILLVLFNSESVLCVLQLSCIFVPKIYLQFTKVRTDFVFGFRMAGIIKTWISVPNEKKDLEIILRETSIHKFS